MRPVTLSDTVPSRYAANILKMNLDRELAFRGPRNQFSNGHIYRIVARVLIRVTNKKINFMSKGHST